MRDAIRYAVILFLFAGLSGLGLGVTYQATRDAIADNDISVTRDAVLRVLPEHDNQPLQDKKQWADYAEQLTAASPDLFPDRQDAFWGEEIYPAYLNGVFVGAAFTVAHTGYGGPIRTVIGVAGEGELLNLEVVSAAQETPGLGLKVTEPDFLNGLLYKDEAAHVHRTLRNTVPFRVSKDGGEIAAVTGATISSRAVIGSVKEGLERYQVLRQVMGTVEEGTDG